MKKKIIALTLSFSAIGQAYAATDGFSALKGSVEPSVLENSAIPTPKAERVRIAADRTTAKALDLDPFVTEALDQYCKGYKQVGRDTVVCPIPGVKTTLAAKPNKKSAVLPFKELDPRYDLNLIGDDGVSMIYSYSHELVSQGGKVVGYIVVTGFANSEIMTRSQFTMKYDTNGKLAMLSVKDDYSYAKDYRKHSDHVSSNHGHNAGPDGPDEFGPEDGTGGDQGPAGGGPDDVYDGGGCGSPGSDGGYEGPDGSGGVYF